MKRVCKFLMIGAAACCLFTGIVGGAGVFAAAEEEISIDDLFTNEIGTQAEISRKKITFVVDGFEFVCPNDYGLIYFDEVGPTVFVTDAFQMRTVIRPVGYDETLKDKEGMTAKALAAGAEITKEVTETEVDGLKVAYFRMNMEEDDMLALYCPSPDPEKSIGGQLVVQNPNLKEEEILKIFADVMKSAAVTDKPNSTREDVENQVYAPEPIGEIKEESTLKHGSQEVTFKVAEGFYSTYEDNCDLYSCESFETEDYATADIYVYDQLIAFEDAESYVRDHAEIYTERTDVKIEKEEVNGHEFTYFSVQYDAEDGGAFQRVYAACDLPNGGMYLIQGASIDNEGTFDIDTVRTFMEIQ